MPKRIKVGSVVHVVPDDATDDEITQLVDGHSSEAVPTATMKAAPSFGSGSWLKEKFYNGVDKGSNALPAVGGIVGGLAGASGGPLTAVGGAALGGAGGESARQLVRRAAGFEDAPASSMDAAKGIGKEALKQGAFEAGGQVVGRAGRAMAPKVAEVAMAPGKRLLKEVPEDVNIGETVLNKTTGIRPKTITNQLKTKIADASSRLEGLTSQADQSLYGRSARLAPSLQPARAVVDDALTAAGNRNSPAVRDALLKVKDQLTTDITTGHPIPANVLPSKIRAMKQGVGEAVGSWSPEIRTLPAVKRAQKSAYGALDSEFNRAVPGSEQLDSELTQLIPAKQAAWNVSYNPSITRNVLNRFGRPTGALAGAGFGAYEGGKEGGTGGAVFGGLAGLVAPELIASPWGQMAVARSLNSPALPRLISDTPRAIDAIMKPTAEDEEKKRLANDR